VVRKFVDVGGGRTLLTVALRKNGLLLGALTVYRQQVRPFSEKEIALLQNFAAQAVIAMENARLITETQEALDQQTATAEVLQVINSSPGDLPPVFDAMLERAVRLCEFDFSTLWIYDGNLFHPVARHGVSERFWDYLQSHTPPAIAGMAGGGRRLHIPDLRESSIYQTDFDRDMRELGLDDVRTLLVVALLKDDALLGVIAAYRRVVRPFSDKQIGLIENFAAQAVIATENARLINETREALEQQTATAEVLQVINSSPGDLEPVFGAMLDKAMRLCGASFGELRTYLGVALRKDDALLGALHVYRQEVRPFTDKQIALLQSFAAQAVIAMENARLLDEIRQRQQELRVTFDNMVDGVAMFDAAMQLAAWNRNFQELLQLSDEFDGRDEP
jgi:GAF domain-containing protein